MPLETRLRRDAAANRERILATARALFAEHGLETSMDEIARAAGVGPGTLYRRFPTKDALVDAILVDALDRIHAVAEAALAEAGPAEGLTRFLEGTLELQLENRALLEVLSLRLPEEPQLAAARDRIRTLVERLVGRAQRAGALRGDVTAPDLHVLLWQLGRVVETTGGSAPELWRRYLALALDGLAAGAAHPLPQPPPTPEQLDGAMAETARRRRPHRRR